MTHFSILLKNSSSLKRDNGEKNERWKECLSREMDGQTDARQYFERKNASMNERTIQIRNERLNETEEDSVICYNGLNFFH